ncbi:MAG: phage tail protein [Desulfamplus sp.]
MPKNDPMSSYRFYVEMDGITEASFQGCEGLDSESEVIEIKESTKGGAVMIKKQPGVIRHSDIILKRGVSSSLELWKWRQMIVNNKFDEARKNGSIVIYDHNDTEKVRWNFTNGWPRKYVGPSLNAAEDAVAIEEIHIAHEGLERVK